jgi:hypothetical protein
MLAQVFAIDTLRNTQLQREFHELDTEVEACLEHEQRNAAGQSLTQALAYSGRGSRTSARPLYGILTTTGLALLDLVGWPNLVGLAEPSNDAPGPPMAWLRSLPAAEQEIAARLLGADLT